MSYTSAEHELFDNGTKGESREETERADNDHDKDQPDDEERAVV
jgi:hypothetical protein